MDLLALLSVLKDGLLCRSEAAALTWDDVERRENGSELINVRRTKTDPQAEGVTLYIGHHAGEALRAIQPPDEPEDFGHWAITAIQNLMKSDTPALPEPRLQDQIRLTLHRPLPAPPVLHGLHVLSPGSSNPASC